MSMVINPGWFAPSGGDPDPGADPYWSYVILLMGFPGANNSTSFADESSYGRAATAVGGAKVSTSQYKFQGSSLALVNGGDYVTLADSADWTMGTIDFTIELWVLFNTKGATAEATFIGQSNAATGWQFGVEVDSQRLNFYTSGQVQVYETNNSWATTLDTWFHVVAERSGSTFRLYRDGVMVRKVTGEIGTIADSSDLMKLGSGFLGSGGRSICLDEVRVTKGVARYGSDGGFAVPTTYYPRHG